MGATFPLPPVREEKVLFDEDEKEVTLEGLLADGRLRLCVFREFMDPECIVSSAVTEEAVLVKVSPEDVEKEDPSRDRGILE
jgi:hypothetical protein